MTSIQCLHQSCASPRPSRCGSVRTTIVHCNQPTSRRWKKYLSIEDNKAKLAASLCKEWLKPKYAVPMFNRPPFATAGNQCIWLTRNDRETVTACEFTVCVRGLMKKLTRVFYCMRITLWQRLLIHRNTCICICTCSHSVHTLSERSSLR